MYNQDIAGLIGKEVEIISQGMMYRGTLVEVSETEVFIKGQMGWIQLSVEGVTDIRPAGRDKGRY